MNINRNLPPSFFATKAQSHRTTWNKMNASALNDKEQEIFNKINERVSSALGVPAKLFDGEPQETERGISLFMTGFTSSDISSPFVISQQTLAWLAENEDDYREFFSRLDTMIMNQIENHASLQNAERYIEQRDSGRRSQQARAKLLSALDFWNEHNDGSWTQLVQGKALQQKISNFSG